ncbi:hypothetical protein SLS62_001041 [Diatrype stigma]|uniref:EGF domain-specific O-linked N-acetylglucosamine transferase n=1 Tax=Diatrype stigma TaxID=117547 RepID=A0AAN9YX51_9PEZI
MEIFSTYMTFDILRMSGDDSGENVPLFRDPDDADDTQVVILDDRDDGPYFDLWTLFARRKPLRFNELLSDRSSLSNLEDVDLIIPLAGSSNPFWKDDDQAQQCNNAPTLNVFSSRVLKFYGIEDPPTRKNDEPIVVTFVKRRDTRRLRNQDHLIASLQRRNSHIRVQMVDFAAIPFSEQVRVARGTDVLVGVHGAGLTQSLFMRQGAGAVVEIQPEELDHNGFRNVAGMRGLGYYRAHASTISPEMWTESEGPKNVREGTMGGTTRSRSDDNESMVEDPGRRRSEARPRNEAESGEIVQREIQGRDGWHWSDIDMEESRFLETVEAAIKFMYNKGPWKFDIS